MNANATPAAFTSTRPAWKDHALLRNRPDICEHLTDAQLQVTRHLVDGMSAPKISKALNRSTNTIHDHINAIYKKLRINTRVQLVLLFTQIVEVKA